MQQLNALKTLKKPAPSRACRRLVDVIGNALLGLGQARAHPKLGQTIHQQAENHDETQSHDALRFLDEDRGCQKERIFEKAKAALHTSLVFVGVDESLLGEGRGRQNVGPHNPTRFTKDFLHDLKIVDAHACLHLPLHLGWKNFFAPTALAPILWMRADFACDLDPRGFAFQFTLQGGTGICFTGKATIGEMPARVLPPALCFAHLSLHRLPDAFDGCLRVDHHPAFVALWQAHLLTEPLSCAILRLLPLLTPLLKQSLCLSQRFPNAADPLHIGLVELPHIRFAVHPVICHVHACLLIRFPQLALDRRDGGEQTRFVAAVAIEWLHEERDIPLLRGCQRQHPLFEILSMVARVAIGNSNEGRFRASRFVRLWRVLATHRKGSRIDVNGGPLCQDSVGEIAMDVRN